MFRYILLALDNKYRNMIKIGYKYKNSTREQIVEVVDYNAGWVDYRVLIGNDNNKIKEFCCSFDRFMNLYVLD